MARVAIIGASIGGFFNTQRMVAQYLHNAYRLAGEYVQLG